MSIGSHMHSIAWWHPMTLQISRSPHYLKSNIWKPTCLKDKVTMRNRKLYLTYGMILFWWPWLTYKHVTEVCQHQLSFLFSQSTVSKHWVCVVCFYIILISLQWWWLVMITVFVLLCMMCDDACLSGSVGWDTVRTDRNGDGGAGVQSPVGR